MNCPKCGSTGLRKHGKAGSGRQRYDCRECGYRTTNPEQTTVPAVKFNTVLPVSPRYVITSAQNATPIKKSFFKTLLQYCKSTNAVLIIIPFRYKNPTSQWTENNEDGEWWDKSIVPYLYDGRFDLNEHLTILADIKIQPTAVNPLTGLETMTGAKSGIVGHPQVEFKTVATPSHKLPKIMTTTGAITELNYTDTKAGKKGEFHHTFGATVVEIDGGTFHLRQINATDNGSFIDLDKSYSTRGVKQAPPAEALVMGDTHVDFVDGDVVEATFGASTGMVSVLKPRRLVWHDLLDFYSRNHHHRNDPMIAVAKQKTGADSVKNEVKRACYFVNKYGKGRENLLIPSNHPDALGRWIKDSDWRFDPVNAEFYLETALEMVKNAEMADSGAVTSDPFHYWAKQWINVPTLFMRRGDHYAVKGIELGIHFDKGANGARGSIKAFSKIGVKSTGGHSHSPGICKGAHQVGTSTRLNLEYNIGGLSSWLQTHEVIYANGKRSLLTVVPGGNWRLTNEIDD